MHTPAHKRLFLGVLHLLLVGFSFCFLFQTHVPSVLAQATPVPTLASAPGTNPVWKYDVEVTEVGKNAERSRQFLFWVLNHPAIHTAPVIAELWGISRNIVFVFIVLVIVAFGLGLILSRRAGSIGPLFNGVSSPFLNTNIPSIFMKIIVILIYVAFSYILVLGVIQMSEISMRFIKSLAGEELFNVMFAGRGNMDDNYTMFIGYKDDNPSSLEMVKTSLTLIRLTSFTYNVMAILLVLRNIFLWFMLILSPFLAILMPFVFIRNTGLIWIGVFIQWLLYGPMVLLFLVALTKIWNSGIPFSFDFSRINAAEGQVFRTSINILYGGPAQTLSVTNSANYIDTYVEYVISLIMLWAAMILPWLLLRIFRDYCCELIASGNNKLSAILDRLRQFPTPIPPSPNYPPGSTGIAVELPFRQRMGQQNVKNVTHFTEQTKIEDIKEISHASTLELSKSMDLSVSSIKDISRLELNQMQRSHVEQQLKKIATPTSAGSSVVREKYSAIRDELQRRAQSGDREAATLLTASENKKDNLVSQVMNQETFERPSIASNMYTTKAARPSIPYVSTMTQFDTTNISQQDISSIATQTGVSQKVVNDVVSNLKNNNGVMNTTQTVHLSQQTGVSETKIQEVISHIQSSASQSTNSTISTISNQTGVTENKVREVMQLIPASGNVTTTQINEITQKTGMTESKVQEIVSQIQSHTTSNNVSQIATQTGVSENKVREVMQLIPASGNVTTTQINEITQKTGMTESKVQEVISKIQSSSSTITLSSQIANQTGISETQVREVMNQIPPSGPVNSTQVKSIVEKTGISEGKVQEVISKIQTTMTSTNSVNQIATNSGVSESKVREVMCEVPASGEVSATQIKNIMQKTGLSETQVQNVVQQMKSVGTQTTNTSTTISATQIAQVVGIEESKVTQVLTKLANENIVNKETIARISTQTQVPVEKIEKIIKATNKPSVLSIQTLSSKVQVPESKVKEVIEQISNIGSMNEQAVSTVAKKTNLPVSKITEIMKESNVPLITSKKNANVTVEDYEEVKSMWLTHYRNSPIPVSESIKNRKQWLSDEEKKLTNISHLLGSADPKLKQEGLERVADILPFMLLGNFSSTEISAYIKAKLEADKQVQSEIEMEEKVKSKVLADVKNEEETLLSVETPKKQEAAKHMTVERKEEIPQDKSGKS